MGKQNQGGEDGQVGNVCEKARPWGGTKAHWVERKKKKVRNYSF